MEYRKIIERMDKAGRAIHEVLPARPYKVVCTTEDGDKAEYFKSRPEAVAYAKAQFERADIYEVAIERYIAEQVSTGGEHWFRVVVARKPGDSASRLEVRRVSGKGPLSEAGPVKMNDILWAVKIAGHEDQELTKLGLPGEAVNAILNLPTVGFGISAREFEKAVREILNTHKVPFKEAVGPGAGVQLGESAVAPRHLKGFTTLSDYGKRFAEWLVGAPTLPLVSVLERGPFSRRINEMAIKELVTRGIAVVSKGQIVAVKGGALKSVAAYSAHRASLGEVVKKGGRPPLKQGVVERMDSLRVTRKEEE